MVRIDPQVFVQYSSAKPLQRLDPRLPLPECICIHAELGESRQPDK